MRRVSPSPKNPLSKLLQAGRLTAGWSNGSSGRPDSFAASEQERRRALCCAFEFNGVHGEMPCVRFGRRALDPVQGRGVGARSRHDLVLKAKHDRFSPADRRQACFSAAQRGSRRSVERPTHCPSPCVSALNWVARKYRAMRLTFFSVQQRESR